MAQVNLDGEQLQDIFFRVHIEIQDQIRKQFGDRIDLMERRLANLEAETKGSTAVVPTAYFVAQSFDRECREMVRQDGYGVVPSVDKNTSSDLQVPDISRDSAGRPSADSSSGVHMHHAFISPEPTVENALPGSFYNFCMYRLAQSPQPLYDPALVWLMMLVLVQFFTMTSFCVSNDLLNNSIGAVHLSERQPVVTNCLFKDSAIFGVPVVQYCIGYVAIVLVASILRSDDNDTLMAGFPLNGNVIVRYLSNFAWFWVVVYMPGCFALEASIMFASSEDALTVVMNTLQVTFIMDIDNMIYRNFVPKEDKKAYQKCVETRDVEMSATLVARCSWRIFALNVVTMTVMFSKVVVMLGEGGELYGEAYIQDYWITTLPFYFIIFSGRFLLRRLSCNAAAIQTWRRAAIENIPASLAAAFMGMVFYQHAFFVSTFRLMAPPWVYFQASDFSACRGGT